MKRIQHLEYLAWFVLAFLTLVLVRKFSPFVHDVIIVIALVFVGAFGLWSWVIGLRYRTACFYRVVRVATYTRTSINVWYRADYKIGYYGTWYRCRDSREGDDELQAREHVDRDLAERRSPPPAETVIEEIWP